MQSKLLNSDVPTENVASVFRIQSLFALGSDFIITELSVLRLHTTSCNYWVIIHPICIGECKGIPDLLYKMWINEGCTGGYAGDHPAEKSFVSAEIQNPRQALQCRNWIPPCLTEVFTKRTQGLFDSRRQNELNFTRILPALTAAAKWKTSHGRLCDLQNKSCVE